MHRLINEYRTALENDKCLAHEAWQDLAAPFEEFHCNNTMLHLAAANEIPFQGWRDSDNLDFAELFLEFGADPNRQNDHGFTPLHYSCMRESREVTMVKLLLEYGADTNLKDKNGYPPIHFAISPREDSRLIVDMLLQNNAQVDFDTAVRLGDANSVRRFLQSGDLTQSRDPRSLLNFAIYADSSETVELLLLAGADPNRRPKYCLESPLYIACGWENVDAVRLLLEHGADPNPRRYKPLAAARRIWKPEKDEIIRMLLIALDQTPM